MTPEQIQLARRLVMSFNKDPISNEEFAALFPSALEDGKLATHILKTAYDDKDGVDLSYALLIGGRFGFTTAHVDYLCRLISEDWHKDHEDVVTTLVRMEARGKQVIEALYEATQILPAYLDYDDARALAVKAIWGLGKIPGDEAEKKLELLAHSNNAILQRNATDQLNRRHKAT